jgi:uncharacterized 2Fe-2S/4Fe-4S cluster protein (DUF4445 family)
MVKKNHKVNFKPEDKIVNVSDSTTILNAVRKSGIKIKSECGGVGVCGSCVVKIINGTYKQKGSERFLSAEEIKNGIVLACRTNIKSDMIIEIPIEARLYEQKILSGGAGRELKLYPNIKKIFIKIAPPTLQDQRADLERLRDSIKKISQSPHISLDVIRKLPEEMRKGNFSITVVLKEDEIIEIEAGNKSDKCYGMAFDIGTTTIVGYLMDMNNGKQLAVATRTNPQTCYGDDVISRIQFTKTNKDGRDILHERIINCINKIIVELEKKAGIEKKYIYEIVTTGNTIMNHLLFKLNPEYIAQIPYVSVINTHIESNAKLSGVRINSYGKIYAMPGIASFAGGDTVAVILASNIHKSKGIKVAIDIGTNGELVMGSRERIISCSTAAGPAFEGARITHGMRASNGAIEKVFIKESGIEINTIGNEKATGLCGSGLIDAVAELLKMEVLSRDGKFHKREDLASHIPGFIKERMIQHDKHGTSFILVKGSDSKTGRDILLSQKDIRETQLAKGAIYAGYNILKKILNVDDDDIEEIFLAGAFGNYIRIDQAKHIGLLPDIPEERIKFIGNAAGEGAKMVLLCKELKKEESEISKHTEYFDLSRRKDFQNEFINAMYFPKYQAG